MTGASLRSRATPSRRDAAIGLLVVLSACASLCPAKLWRPMTIFGPSENPQIAEAQALWKGRLDLAERYWDTALVPSQEPPRLESRPDAESALQSSGRVYSHFPPMFSFLAVIFVPVFGGVPHIGILLLIVLPIPLLAYRLFLRETQSPVDAGVLTLGLVVGTSLWPVLDKTLRGGSPYFVNQALAVLGQLIFLNEFFGKRRPGRAAAGVIVSALSRQLTTAYLIPLAWMTYRFPHGGAKGSARGESVMQEAGSVPDPAVQLPKRSMLILTLATLIVVGVPLIANTLKFGSPFENGYRFVYNDRAEDPFSRDANQFGIFSPHYVFRNFYFMHLGPPEVHTIEMEGQKVWRLRLSDWGTGIWWTTPLLLFLFLDFRRILRNPAARVLLLASTLVGVALLFYHSTGFRQHGFNRYSMDFVPGLYTVVAMTGLNEAGTVWKLLAVVWGILYFGWVL